MDKDAQFDSLNQRPSFGGLGGIPSDTLAEDSAAITRSVTQVLNGNVNDTTGSSLGIAITSVDKDTGAWAFSLNNGNTFVDFGNQPAGSALVFDSTALRFTPGKNLNGNAGITFHAWDQSDGTASGTLLNSHSGNAFSSGTPILGYQYNVG